MPLAAALAASLTNHAARTWQVLIDGLDVAGDPISRRYYVPIDSVHTTIKGPGGVSSATFRIVDAGKLITVSEGQLVRIARLDAPYGDDPSGRAFLGVISTYTISLMEGDVGRTIDVTCDGIEGELLDGRVTTAALTFTLATTLQDMILAIVAVTPGLADLRAFGDTINEQGSDAKPVGLSQLTNQDPTTLAVIPVTIPAGRTLREAIMTAAAVCVSTVDVGQAKAVQLTIDGSFGLRAYEYNSTAVGPFPNATNFYPWVGPPDAYMTDPTYTVDGAGVIRGVFVIGTGASAYVSDGSGKRGRITVLNDTSLTTTAACRAAGANLIAINAAKARGSFGLSDVPVSPLWTMADVLRILVLTDATLGLAADSWYIGQLDVTFHGDRNGSFSEADVSYGGAAPSAAALIRQLTRDTLS